MIQNNVVNVMVSVFCAKASIHVLNRSLGLVSGVEPDEERMTG